MTATAIVTTRTPMMARCSGYTLDLDGGASFGGGAGAPVLRSHTMRPLSSDCFSFAISHATGGTVFTMTRDPEVWQAIDASCAYEVSQFGRVRWADGRIKLPTTSRDGTLVVNLYANGRNCVRAVHTLVAGAFLGPRPAGHMVVHKDNDPTNCHAVNLSYQPLSRREPRWASERGRYLVGKLTQARAAEIRRRALAGELTRNLAEEFGVSSALVSNIKHGVKWKA